MVGLVTAAVTDPTIVAVTLVSTSPLTSQSSGLSSRYLMLSPTCWVLFPRFMLCSRRYNELAIVLAHSELLIRRWQIKLSIFEGYYEICFVHQLITVPKMLTGGGGPAAQFPKPAGAALA